MTAVESTQTEPLSTRLTELVNYAADARVQLESFVAGLPSGMSEQRAHADAWTVAEHVEHLALIEDSIGRLISSMAKKLRADGAFDTSTESLLSSLDEYSLPANTFKLVAPAPYRPTGTLSTEDALAKLRSVRTRMLEGVQKANGLDLAREKFPHPFFGPLDGYQWLLLIGQHELRHLNQMKDTVHNRSTVSTAPAPSASAPSASTESR